MVLNNDGGGIFSYLPIASSGIAFRELFTTPHGLELQGVARLFGLGYEHADDPGNGRARVRVIDPHTSTRFEVACQRVAFESASSCGGESARRERWIAERVEGP